MKAIGIAAIRLGCSGNPVKQVGMPNCRVAAYLNQALKRTRTTPGAFGGVIFKLIGGVVRAA
jgi:hypothetical protein